MNLLEIKELKVDYTTKSGVSGETKLVHAINGINLGVRRGEILAVAGESGCGKSTLAKAIMKLVDIKNGEIIFQGTNSTALNSIKEIRQFYQKVQMVFQNPYSSLNPKMKIGSILKEPLLINKKLSSQEITRIVEEKISQVGLDTSILDKYPHEFSGGQRQRIAIARALILEPELIIADEPVSALDVSIQAQIINLLKNLKENLGLTFIFISHDLSVIKYISDRIAVMYLGEIVEIGKTSEIFDSPKHPYTQALLSSVPQIGSKTEDTTIQLEGELPSAEKLPSGCKFHTRCPYVMDKCKDKIPEEHEFSLSHRCKCFLYTNENSMI